MIIFHLLDDFILTFSFHQNTKSSTNHRAPGLCTNTSSMCFQCIKKNHFIVCLNTLNLNFGYEKDNYIARIYENNVKSFEILWVKGGTIR